MPVGVPDVPDVLNDVPGDELDDVPDVPDVPDDVLDGVPGSRGGGMGFSAFSVSLSASFGRSGLSSDFSFTSPDDCFVVVLEDTEVTPPGVLCDGGALHPKKRDVAHIVAEARTSDLLLNNFKGT